MFEKEALDEKYSYQIDEHGMVHLFRGEEDCQQYLTNPLLSAIFKIEALKKENAGLNCQMNRNKFCYSCANATDRCFRNEIGCPCEKYKSHKDKNAELKKKLEILIAVESTCTKGKQLTKAKELLTRWVELFKPKGGNIPPTPIQVETEQFISEE